jgi:hypothetical protein
MDISDMQVGSNFYLKSISSGKTPEEVLFNTVEVSSIEHGKKDTVYRFNYLDGRVFPYTFSLSSNKSKTLTDTYLLFTSVKIGRSKKCDFYIYSLDDDSIADAIKEVEFQKDFLVTSFTLYQEISKIKKTRDLGKLKKILDFIRN